MSRIIENDHLFDADEVEYLTQRNQIKLIETNKAEFGSAAKGSDSKIKLDSDTIEHVKGLSAEDTVKELEERGLSTDGELKDQKARLAVAIQEAKA